MPQMTVTMGNLWLEGEDDPDEVSKAEVLTLQWYMTSTILYTLRNITNSHINGIVKIQYAGLRIHGLDRDVVLPVWK